MKKIDKTESRSMPKSPRYIRHKDFEIPDDVVFPDEITSKQIDNLEKTTKKSLKRQIKALESIADSAKKRAELAAAQAENAEKEAKIARRDARFAKVVSVLAIIIPILWDNLKPYLPIISQKISELLSAN